eukprot:COSAG02_NODE_5727_length_4089_cov_2.288471_6_plen_75_part_00
MGLAFSRTNAFAASTALAPLLQQPGQHFFRIKAVTGEQMQNKSASIPKTLGTDILHLPEHTPKRQFAYKRDTIV